MSDDLWLWLLMVISAITLFIGFIIGNLTLMGSIRGEVCARSITSTQEYLKCTKADFSDLSVKLYIRGEK